MGLMNSLMIGVGISSLAMNVMRMIFLATVQSYAVGQVVFFTMSGAYLIACSYLAFSFLNRYDEYQKQEAIKNGINSSSIK